MTVHRALGQHLQELREAAGRTVEDAAKTAGMHAERLRLIEGGRAGVDVAALTRLCEAYGVEWETRSVLLHTVKRSMLPGWWWSFNDLLPPGYARYLEAEQTAVGLRTYTLGLIPDLLQTPSYARAVLKSRYAGAELDRRCGLRARRRNILHGGRLHAVHALIDEAALRRPFGGPQVMRAQLQHLTDLCAQEHVTIQICPMAAAAHAPPGAPITLLRLPGRLPDLVWLEHQTGDGDWPPDVARYRTMLDRAEQAARPPQDTPELLARIGEETGLICHGTR